MCVIVIKPRGLALPEKELMKKCWADNPDGGGFAIVRKDDTIATVEKGFMTFKSFYHYLTKYDIDNDDLVVLHFRYATHGYKSAGQTHPFPVSKYLSKLEELQFKSDTVVFHNGIIKMKDQIKGWSDTMQYVGGVMSYMQPLDFNKITEQTKGNRLCIVHDGKVTLTGEGWEKEDGYIYSNLSWKTGKRRVAYYAGTGSVFQEMTDAEWEEFQKENRIG